jgi:hypothetical protein
MPWRLRIALCFIRGFLVSPRKALHYGRDITVMMPSVYRFNLHIHGERFLRHFLEESERLGMRPFLLWGSLLGCMREGRMLDHDCDIDLGILETDYPKKDALIRAMIARGYRLRFDHPYKFSIDLKDGLLHIDVDLLYEWKGLLISSMPSERTGDMEAHQFPKEAFRELKRRKFGNIQEVWVPGNAERVLEWAYGEWRVPKKTFNYETDLLSKVKDPSSLNIEACPIPWVGYKDPSARKNGGAAWYAATAI